MGIKRYILLALIYIIGVGLYIYSFNGESFTLAFFGFSLVLPIAVWIVVPTFLLFFASVIHLTYYYVVYLIHKRELKKDFEAFELSAKNIILEENVDISYKTEGFKLVGKILQSMSFNSASCVIPKENEELSKVCTVVANIKNGQYEDLKKYKLSKTNPLVIQNNINRLKVEPKYAIEVLKNSQDKSSELCLRAYDALLDFATFNEIKKYDFTPDKRTFRRMMERYLDEKDNFEIDIKSIEEMLEKFNANREDYLELAREIKPKLSPDALIALFEKLYNTKGSLAADAYLYVLYDLQMIHKIKEILENSDADEFVKFRTVIFLRDHGKSIDIDKFLAI